MSDASAFSANAQLGTLVWIGDPATPEFQAAYDYCVATVAQLALRTNLDEALCRPAANVRCVVLSRATRSPIETMSLDHLARLYPEASILNLMGTLCEGMPVTEEGTRGVDRLYWHRWNQVLPQWLSPCGARPEQSHGSSRSVAVLASTFACGEPLLDLAESSGATAVWCRSPESLRVRNVDAVWWDDSLAPPTSYQGWRQRISAFSAGGQRTQHAWIANSPRHDQQRHATRGGVDVVISKPHRIEGLLSMLAHTDVNQSVGSATALKAA